ESIQGEEFFDSFELVISKVNDNTNRVMRLHKGEVCYFPPGSESYTYAVSYTNRDGESATGDSKTFTPRVNTQYNFTYNIETNTLQTNE
ncbi:MAG: hypothetical protein Q4A54_14860, partial [Parabacteroides sp.]|nr:hypothetical protein [Parabacteroides sp.]